MGFDLSSKREMPALKCRVDSSHKRSNSFPNKRINENGLDTPAFTHLKLDMAKAQDHINIEKKQSPKIALQSTLKNEIIHLERRLQDQFSVRQALEKALGYKSSSTCISNENLMPKPAKELIKEIAMLELEVVYLEQYLLSLYRKAFDQQVASSSPSATDERVRSPPKDVAKLDTTSKRENLGVHSSRCLLPRAPIVSSKKEINDIRSTENLIDCGVQRSHSSLSYRSVCPTRVSPAMENLDKALRSCHSQPLSFLQYVQDDTTNVISLAEHLGTRISDHVPETPNRLSEDIIRSMASIYCKLANPPLTHVGHSSSPTSSLSSASAFSPQDQGDMWSPHCKKESSIDARVENPFRIEGLRELSEAYRSMIEITGICRDSQRLNDVAGMLQNFKSLVQRLEKVDPRKLNHDEKVAFWTNIHNALVMHAYLAYGIPQNSIKRGALLLKAAYKVGGQTVSADMIQTSILECRTNRSGQWFRIFFTPKMKLKEASRQSYAIEHPEPLLHFALCTGSHSDPAVRTYTAKRVFQELEAAKEEYIKATVSIQKGQKILLPKTIESFAKDSSLSSAGVVDMVQKYLPDSLRKDMQRCQKEKPRKSVEWAPHKFDFRYLLSKELVK